MSYTDRSDYTVKQAIADLQEIETRSPGLTLYRGDRDYGPIPALKPEIERVKVENSETIDVVVFT